MLLLNEVGCMVTIVFVPVRTIVLGAGQGRNTIGKRSLSIFVNQENKSHSGAPDLCIWQFPFLDMKGEFQHLCTEKESFNCRDMTYQIEVAAIQIGRLLGKWPSQHMTIGNWEISFFFDVCLVFGYLTVVYENDM